MAVKRNASTNLSPPSFMKCMKGVSDDARRSLCKQYDQGKWEANSEKFRADLRSSKTCMKAQAGGKCCQNVLQTQRTITGSGGSMSCCLQPEGEEGKKNILCPLCCLHYSTIYVKYKSTLKIVSRVTNTITLPPRLAVLRYSFWSSYSPGGNLRRERWTSRSTWL